VSQLLSKRPRIRLRSEAYKALRREVLKRDGWKCQACGTIAGLEVHHLQRRSQLGDDSASNLITLCSECHRVLHS